ncbi:hypothetical protein MKZ38_002568 [Zalerion maritima]|uniref:Protein kinase domain-containing protein n=1 Tax=Zalerion maritima TaxID=339359 RepID=A0AAD5RQ11_9PEZI|nr:hypothetical protein MKZ38_002568 [Zalerion maritima]
MDERGKQYLGVKQRYCPAVNEEVSADIVAVHGLGGNPYWSWVGTRKDTSGTKVEIDWLRELLPKFVPRCRVLSFGYQSHYLKHAPKRDITNCAEELLHALSNYRLASRSSQRPIIFLCHSLGGIVVKEALVKATLASQLFGSIRISTRGIIFLGTPHNGSSSAKYGEALASIARAVGSGSDTTLVHSLREQSPELLKLARNFADIYDAFDIFCFYELEPMAFSKVIVTQSSASIIGRPSDGLYADHGEMNRFSHEDDPNLVKVVNVMRNMVASLSKGVRGSPAATPRAPKPWEVAAISVQEVDRSLERCIQMLQTQGNSHDNSAAAQSLVILRYNFQSWAFQHGLLALSGKTMNLHVSLDNPSLAETLNSHLGKTVEFLETRNRESHPAGLTDSAFLELIRKKLGQLSRIIPETDNGLAASIFTGNLMLQSASSVAKLDAATCSGHDSPDIGGLIAMKRISLLMEQAGNNRRRPSSDRLVVHLKTQLVLDRQISRSLSTGKFSGRSASLGRSSRVECAAFVEWKYYRGSIWSTDAGNVLFERVELLADFLRAATSASAASEDINLCIPHCLGYCHDAPRERLGLVFAVPRGVPDRSSAARLGDLLEAFQEKRKAPPSVGSRIQLARMLCETVFGLHVSGWFHKGINARNIVFFSEAGGDTAAAAAADDPTSSSSSDDENGDDKELDLDTYSILTPHLLGFGHSRPGTPGAFSEPGALSGATRRYMHPLYDASVSPLQKYKHEFDYYSLGVLLVEIGYWMPLETLLQVFSAAGTRESGRKNMSKRSGKGGMANGLPEDVSERLVQGLSGVVGDVFRGVVADLLLCLEVEEGGGGGGGGDGDGDSKSYNNELMDVASLVSFQTGVLEALGSCRV